MKKLILSILGCLLGITLSAHHLSFVDNVANSDNETVISTSIDSSFDLLSSREKRKKRTYSKKEKNITEQEEISENEKDDPNTVTLIVTGEGSTKDEATKNALRSAIEQAFGTFVSANTEVLNDELVKDEIVTITSGNIQKYTEVYYSDAGSMKSITLQAKVSVGNLVSYAKNKGMQAELSGATFLMNKKMRDLNEKNEDIAFENLYKQLCDIASNGLFDYSIELQNPVEETAHTTRIPFSLIVTPNQNAKKYIDCLTANINKLKLSLPEILEYEKSGREVFESNHDKFRHDKFRSKKSLSVIGNIYKMVEYSLKEGFVFCDNLGNRYAPSESYIYASTVEKVKCNFLEMWYNLDNSGYIKPNKFEGTIYYNNTVLEKINSIEVKPYTISPWTLQRVKSIDKEKFEWNSYSISEKLRDKNLLTSAVYNFNEDNKIYLRFEGSYAFSPLISLINEIAIYNGDQFSEKYYYYYGRIKDYTLYLINGKTKEQTVISEGTLKDTPDVQLLKLPSGFANPYDLYYLFVVKTIYPGKKKGAWAISEIATYSTKDL